MFLLKIQFFNHIAYFLVHSLACCSYFGLSFIYIVAIYGTNGSSGLGSVNKDEIERSTFEIVRAGDHVSFKMSRQIDPLALMLGWKIRVVN